MIFGFEFEFESKSESYCFHMNEHFLNHQLRFLAECAPRTIPVCSVWFGFFYWHMYSLNVIFGIEQFGFCPQYENKRTFSKMKLETWQHDIRIKANISSNGLNSTYSVYLTFSYTYTYTWIYTIHVCAQESLYKCGRLSILVLMLVFKFSAKHAVSAHLCFLLLLTGSSFIRNALVSHECFSHMAFLWSF